MTRSPIGALRDDLFTVERAVFDNGFGIVEQFDDLAQCFLRLAEIARLFLHNAEIVQDLRVNVGPLIDGQAFEGMQAALAAAKAQGGQVFGG